MLDKDFILIMMECYCFTRNGNLLLLEGIITLGTMDDSEYLRILLSSIRTGDLQAELVEDI